MRRFGQCPDDEQTEKKPTVTISVMCVYVLWQGLSPDNRRTDFIISKKLSEAERRY